MSSLPSVVILGRPNVGKSTLFNRIAGRRRALVGDEPGMTRDRLYAEAEWLGKRFQIVDTGGLLSGGDSDLIAGGILRSAQAAIDEATHLILVVDGRQGLTPVDEELARLLRRTGKPLTAAVNKVDSAQLSALAADFHHLGLTEMVPISAEHGLGIDQLLEQVTANLSASSSEEAEPEDNAIRVAIIGRPNVGKSTLLNALLDEERSIVTPLPGTTRDAVDAQMERSGHRFRLIDTAGIRRKGKTKLLAEKLSVIQARKHLEQSDVALLVLDAVEGLTALDTHIGGYAHESHRSVVIVVNKWDAMPKGPSVMRDYSEQIRRRLKYLDYAPIVFVSAAKRYRLEKLVATLLEVAAARRQRVATAEMNRFMQELDFERVPSPAGPGGRPLRLYYVTQAGVAPPRFIAFTNRSGPLHFSVERFLENRIRERFPFPGTPLVIKARAKR